MQVLGRKQTNRQIDATNQKQKLGKILQILLGFCAVINKKENCHLQKQSPEGVL